MKKNILLTYLFSIGVTTILAFASCSLATPTSEPVDLITLTVLPTPATTQTTIPALAKTPLPVNTLTAQERENFVRESIISDLSCRFPCWWGITPGETTWVETERLLYYLGVRIGTSPGYDSDAIFHGTGGFDFEGISIKNSFSFEEHNGVVDAILIRSDGYNKLEEYQALWENYSPKKIILMYGVPDQVWLNVPSSSPSTYRGYYLWLFYDQSGFMIRYHGQVLNAPILHVCPRFEDDGYIAQIELRLQSLDNLLPLERFDAILDDVKKGTDTGKLRVIHSIQDATGLSEKEFYDIFVRDEPACFDTPRDIWATK